MSLLEDWFAGDRRVSKGRLHPAASLLLLLIWCTLTEIWVTVLFLSSYLIPFNLRQEKVTGYGAVINLDEKGDDKKWCDSICFSSRSPIHWIARLILIPISHFSSSFAHLVKSSLSVTSRILFDSIWIILVLGSLWHSGSLDLDAGMSRWETLWHESLWAMSVTRKIAWIFCSLFSSSLFLALFPLKKIRFWDISIRSSFWLSFCQVSRPRQV